MDQLVELIGPAARFFRRRYQVLAQLQRGRRRRASPNPRPAWRGRQAMYCPPRSVSLAGSRRHASFTPVRAPGGIGSGVHIHFSLWDLEGRPVLYHRGAPGGLSAIGAAFASGVAAHMPALCALTAPSVISYERLQPHRWSAAYTCLGERNREAALRICPVLGRDDSEIARQFNLEWRAAAPTMLERLVTHQSEHAVNVEPLKLIVVGARLSMSRMRKERSARWARKWHRSMGRARVR